MAATEPSVAADAMAPALPTESLPEIPQDPGLAGTLLVAETLLGPHLSLQALTSGKFHLVTHDTTQEITRDMYDGLLAAHNSKHSSNVSLASDITGLASHVSVKREGTPDEHIEWSDIDPELASRLKRDPEALKAYEMVKQPQKQARLDPALGKFAPINPPSQVSSSSSANIESACSADKFGSSRPHYKDYQFANTLSGVQNYHAVD